MTFWTAYKTARKAKRILSLHKKLEKIRQQRKRLLAKGAKVTRLAEALEGTATNGPSATPIDL